MGEPETTDPWIGQELSSYVVIKQLGHGGMGIVYLGRHRSLDRLAAIKFLAAQLVSDEVSVQLFLREAKATANLSHPNIVTIYDAGQANDDVFYFVMEYVEGRNLRTIQEDVEILPVRDAVEYVRQAANALAYAHRKHIIHRDIKPENLMLTRDGVIKVGDLGLAKWVGDPDGYMTQQGMVYGSPFYISPERLRDAKCADPQSDIYSLGATLFHLTTGRLPYEGSTPVVMAAHLSDPVPEPAEANPKLDADLCGIIKKMMAKDLKERFQSMEQVEDALIDYQLKHFHASPALRRDTRPVGEQAGPAPRARGLPVKPILYAVMAAALLGIGLLFFRSPSRQPASTPAVAPAVAPAPTPPPLSAPAPSVPDAGHRVIIPPEPGTDQKWNTVQIQEPVTTQQGSDISMPDLLADFNSAETSGMGISTFTSLPPNPAATCGATIDSRGIAGSDALLITYDMSGPGSFCGVVLQFDAKPLNGNNRIRLMMRSATPTPAAVEVIARPTKGSDEGASRFKASGIVNQWKPVEFPLVSDQPIRELIIQLRYEWSEAASGFLAIDDITLFKK